MHMICKFFQVFFYDGNIDLLDKELKYAKELLQNHYRKSVQNSEVAGHVAGVKTVVTKHLHKMLRSRTCKSAERNTAARIN